MGKKNIIPCHYIAVCERQRCLSVVCLLPNRQVKRLMTTISEKHTFLTEIKTKQFMAGVGWNPNSGTRGRGDSPFVCLKPVNPPHHHHPNNHHFVCTIKYCKLVTATIPFVPLVVLKRKKNLSQPLSACGWAMQGPSTFRVKKKTTW